MNSFFETLYKEIQEKIENKIPEIKGIEPDFGQEKYKQWRENKQFPLLLIRFPETTYESLSNKAQTAQVQINMKLLFKPYTQLQETDPLEVSENALNIFEIEQKVVEALHGWMPGNYCQHLIRSKTTGTYYEEINLHTREIVFTTFFQEYFGE